MLLVVFHPRVCQVVHLVVEALAFLFAVADAATIFCEEGVDAQLEREEHVVNRDFCHLKLTTATETAGRRRFRCASRQGALCCEARVV